MKHVISGVAKFQKDVYPQREEQFKKLANGQSPEVLFITCADSRIDPNLITQTDPGELFVCRNAGNVVPPHSNQAAGGMVASTEFAVAALGVKHIVVCGHSNCGAMKGAINPDALSDLPSVKEWLGHCRAAAEVIKEKHGSIDLSHLESVTLENVLLQLQNLRTHPAVAAKLATGEIQLHGWFYNIETSEVLCFDEESNSFKPMDELYATLFDDGDLGQVG